MMHKLAQSAKDKVLQKIIDWMDDEEGSDLMKKPGAAVVEVSAEKPEDGDADVDGDDADASPLAALGKGDDDGADDDLLRRLIEERMKLK